MPTVYLVIHGKVQGVFFRASARKAADALGIKGWVKNRQDGNVDIMASGSEEKLVKFIEWCSQGPSGAEVSAVEQSVVADVAFGEFSIRK
jgi:acylphosphatase